MSHPPANGAAIEVDDENDAASGYDSSDAQSSTQSLASSLNKYLEENGMITKTDGITMLSDWIGRRYHTYYGEDKVFMPNDEVSDFCHAPAMLCNQVGGCPQP